MVAVSVKSSAATDDNTSLTKVLSAKDIRNFRLKWDDTSNIGPEEKLSSRAEVVL